MKLQSGNSVFTPGVLLSFKKFISRRRMTNSILCEWDEVVRLKQLSSKINRLKFYLSALVTFFHALYLTSATSSQIVRHKSVMNLLWTFLWGLYYIWATGNNVNIMIMQDDSVQFIRGMIQLDSLMELSGNVLTH